MYRAHSKVRYHTTLNTPKFDAQTLIHQGSHTSRSLCVIFGTISVTQYRGTSLIREHSPPYDPPRTLGISLR